MRRPTLCVHAHLNSSERLATVLSNVAPFADEIVVGVDSASDERCFARRPPSGRRRFSL